MGRGLVRKGILITVLALTLLCGCTGPSDTSRSTARLGHREVAPIPAITTHEVVPSTADAAASGPNEPDVAVVGGHVSWNGRLVVFLPGSGGRPSCCALFLDEAAALGFHALGLTYNNTVAVGTRCQDDLACYGTVRQNVFDGTGPSAVSDLSPADGVEARLEATLTYLARRYPAEGWGRFVTGGLPNYALIVLAGHSQGGGEAAFIATQRRVTGVVTLSSPPDTNSAHQAAPWVAAVPEGATPLARFFGFVHTRDPFGPRILADWAAMGLGTLGNLTPVDSVATPYGGSHELISSLALPDVVLAAHDSTAVANAQPRCAGGSSAYVRVWAYLLDSAAGLPVVAVASTCAA
jgi:hypothetical protein